LKRIFIIIGRIIVVLLGLAALFWLCLHYYIIPRFVIPQIREQIAIFNRHNQVNLKIQQISFQPLRGFQLTGIELQPLLTAKEIDLDLDYLALLSRRLHLPQINIIEADLKVVRSGRGRWNFEPTVKNIFGQRSPDRTSFIDIDQIIFSRGRIDFDDQFHRDNRLTKHFTEVNLKISCPARGEYFVVAAGADIKRQDAIRFEFYYAAKTGGLQGRAQLQIANLADYRDYYLDDLIAPWQLIKGQATAQAKFSYLRGTVLVEGDYEIKRGQINYGDIRLTGNGLIHQQGWSARANLTELALRFEKTAVLEQGHCEVAVSDQAVQIKTLQGSSQGKPVDLKGQFVFRPSRRLDLTGRIGEAANVLHLKLFSANTAQVAWLASTEAAYLKVEAELLDIERLRFSGQVSGQADLAILPSTIMIKADERHLTVSMEASHHEIQGQVSFAGNLQGELDKIESLNGKLGLKFTDFSLLGLEPLSFLLGLKVDKGVFASGIPTMALYQGKLSGAVILDAKRWGIALDIVEMDLAKFTKVNSQLTGLAGLFTGQIACLGNWGASNSVRGGGSFNLQDADLKKLSILASAQQGVGSVVKDFQLPDFREVTGSFEIADDVVNFSNVVARAPDLELRGWGTIDLAGQVDLTMGVKFIQKRDVKTALYIFFPLPTLGFDLLTKAIQVEIKGVMPELKQTTTVQPLGWLTDAYAGQRTFDPAQYDLKKMWTNSP
jgi:hypothetical protein